MKKTIEIQLDKKRNLRYTLNSFRILEKQFGISVDKLGENITMETIQALLYVGLIHEDKKLTFEAVGDMVDFGNLPDVNQKISEAFLIQQS